MKKLFGVKELSRSLGVGEIRDVPENARESKLSVPKRQVPKDQEKSGDTVTFYIVDGIIKGWEKE